MFMWRPTEGCVRYYCFYIVCLLGYGGSLHYKYNNTLCLGGINENNRYVSVGPPAWPITTT